MNPHKINEQEAATAAGDASTIYSAPIVPAQTFLFSIDEYQILSELGGGAFGVVYLAQDTKLNRRVAIKKLKVGPEASVDELIRFRGEAEALGAIQHPNIVQIYNTGTHQGSPYLVMEYVDGGTLSQQLKGEPRHPRQAAELIETLARAIQVAHEHGVIHRDLKPGNILLKKQSIRDERASDSKPPVQACSGIPKIADFGLAKRLDCSEHLTRTGAAVGTPSYMAPEQARGDRQIGPETDVYALGAILYELLTGRPPFRGPDVFEVIAQVRSVEPLSPSRLVPKLPRDLSTICLKCLEKLPSRRYHSALELAEDLRRYLDGKEILARPASRLERTWRTIRRHPLQSAILALSLTLAALISWMVVQHYVKQNEERIARLEEARKDAEKRLIDGEYSHSLEALSDILRLVGEGSELQKIPEIAPLHRALLTYYDRLIARQEGNPMAPRERLADACRNLGKLIKATGQYERANEAFTKAIALYGKLISDYPERTEFQRKQALALLERARCLDELGIEDKAKADYEQSLARLETLTKQFPQNVDYQHELGTVWHWLAVLYARDQKTYREAKQAYDKAIAVFLSAQKSDGWKQEYNRDLARTYGYYGDLLLELGEMAKADATYWNSHRLREEMVKTAQGNAVLEEKFQLARSWANFGGMQTRLRLHRTAINFFDKALLLRKELVEANPARSEFQRDLADGSNSVAELLLLSEQVPGQMQEAKERLQTAKVIYEKEHEKQKDVVLVTIGLGTNRALRARCALIEGKLAEAKQLLNEAKQNFVEVQKRRNTADVHYQLAAIEAMQAELSPPDQVQAGVTQALESLAKAMELRFRRLHPLDVERDRAFASCRSAAPFRQLLGLGE